MNSDSLGPGVPRIPGLRDSAPGAAYKKGDVIDGKYEVFGVLGAGGFGIVYLVYSHETKEVYALKTFLDKYLADASTRERFRKEASVWVDLERHPYLVRAYFVTEIAGRLFIAMEHIARDEWTAPDLLDTFLSGIGLFLVVVRAEIAQTRVSPLAIIEQLDVLDNCCFGLQSGPKPLPVD